MLSGEEQLRQPGNEDGETPADEPDGGGGGIGSAPFPITPQRDIPGGSQNNLATGVPMTPAPSLAPPCASHPPTSCWPSSIYLYGGDGSSIY